MKEQILCPTCLHSGEVEGAGYCKIEDNGLQSCKRNKDHEQFPSSLEGSCVVICRTDTVDEAAKAVATPKASPNKKVLESEQAVTYRGCWTISAAPHPPKPRRH